MSRLKVKRIRKTKLERAAERKGEQDYWYGKGLREGREAASKEFQAELKTKLANTNIELARNLGQMVEATSRAVVTFVAEGGIRG